MSNKSNIPEIDVYYSQKNLWNELEKSSEKSIKYHDSG